MVQESISEPSVLTVAIRAKAESRRFFSFCTKMKRRLVKDLYTVMIAPSRFQSVGLRKIFFRTEEQNNLQTQDRHSGICVILIYFNETSSHFKKQSTGHRSVLFHYHHSSNQLAWTLLLENLKTDVSCLCSKYEATANCCLALHRHLKQKETIRLALSKGNSIQQTKSLKKRSSLQFV